MGRDGIYHLHLLIGRRSKVGVQRLDIVLLIIVLAGLWADPSRAAGPLAFDTVIDTEMNGGRVFVATASFIRPDGDRLYDQRTFTIPPDILKTVVAAYLCVTGESARIQSDSDIPASVSVPVRCIARYRKHSLETLYHDIFRIDPERVGAAGITVKGLMSDAVNPSGQFKFSMASATVVVIYKKPEKILRRIRFFAGLSNPPPGDVYTFSFPRVSEKYQPIRLTVGGGHGIKGNATGNVLNGVTLSGRDDWDGSSGPMWDLDTYDLKKWLFDNIMKYRFGIDTILNWIYPEILIFEEELKS